jgi:3-phosphoshikimate 1-carboxyvinyltransferase
MFRYFGADIEPRANGAIVRGGRELEGREVTVPADISSAAFFIVAALLVPGSELLIANVGVNPTRTGILDILLKMGAAIDLLNAREVSGEPVADILVRSSSLRGVEISGDLVPRAIDEFPSSVLLPPVPKARLSCGCPGACVKKLTDYAMAANDQGGVKIWNRKTVWKLLVLIHCVGARSTVSVITDCHVDADCRTCRKWGNYRNGHRLHCNILPDLY